MPFSSIMAFVIALVAGDINNLT